MIQRVQSIYLLLAVVVAGILPIYLPLWGQADEMVYSLDLLTNEDLILKVIPFGFIGSSLLGLLGILLFKNRSKQITVNRLNIAVNFLLLGIMVYHLLNLPGEGLSSEKGIGVFIPIVVIVMVALANKGIIKDEKLVKSVDRLR